MAFSRSFLGMAKQFAFSFAIIAISSTPAAVLAQETVAGFDYFGVGGTECYCLFDNEIVTSNVPEGFNDYFEGHSGFGEIGTSDGYQGVICYKFDVTSAPSLTPSQLPTDQVEQVEGFDYVGVGYCTDANGSHYDYYASSGTGFGTNSCATLCGGIGIDGLVGFSLEKVEGGRCVCWMNNNIVTADLPSGFDNFWHGNSGAGPVLSRDTSKTTYICYKVEETSMPSLMPSQSPSTQPSNKPSNTPSNIFSKYSNIATNFGFSDPTFVVGSTTTFQVDFTNSIPQSTIHAAIIATSSCTNENSNQEVKTLSAAGGVIGSVVSDASTATITKDIESDVTLEDKNSGSATIQYCLRADLYDDSNDTISIAAKKVDLQIDITYQTEGDFIISNIQTSEFVASSTSTSATRSVGIKVFKESCSTGCEILGGDTNGCFTNQVEVGSILALCLKALENDVDLTGIESATVQAADYSSAIVVFSGDGSAGTDNFVTTTKVADGEVTLETLLIPAYYDALDGGASGSLEVSGTVLLSYVDIAAENQRRLGRDLQDGDQVQEDSPFSISIPLNNPSDVPEIAQGVDESSASSFNMAMVISVTGGVMAVLA